MAILFYKTDTVGLVGDVPRIVRVKSDDSFATVTAAGYLTPLINNGFALYSTDIVLMYYGTNSASFGVFTITLSAGIPTANAWNGTAGIDLPTTAGNFAFFDNTTGNLADLAISPSSAAQPKVASVDGATVATRFPVFADTAGTITDLGVDIHANKYTYAGGAASFDIAIVGLSSFSIPLVSIQSSTNAVSIQKVTAATNKITVTCSADPGSSVFNYWYASTNF